MNEYEIMIKNLENRVTELEKQLFARAVKTVEPVKWQPKRGAYYIGSDGTTYNYANSVDKRRLFGHERQTEEQIKRASIEMRRFNRLLALRDELCGDEVVYWSDNDKQNYFVCFSHQTNRWYVSSDEIDEVIQPYFTNKESAQKACDMLNSGEVEL